MAPVDSLCGAAILAREAQHSAARHQADLLVRALPDSPVAFFVAGRIDSAFGAPARGRELMSRGVHLHSASGSGYTMRMKYRPWSDLAERRADGWYQTRRQSVVFVDREGDGYRVLSATCSHLGCSVRWNAGAAGDRYSALLVGPAWPRSVAVRSSGGGTAMPPPSG